MTCRGSKEASVSSKEIRGGREATGDGATGRSVKAFQFGDIGSA